MYKVCGVVKYVEFSVRASSELRGGWKEELCLFHTKQGLSKFAYNSVMAVRLLFCTVQIETAPSSFLISLLRGLISLESIWANPALFHKTFKVAATSAMK